MTTSFGGIVTAFALVPFPASAAGTVAGWANTGADVSAWCSRPGDSVPPEIVAGWAEADDVRAYLLLDGDVPIGYGELWLDDDESEVEIAHVIVDPARRGQRAGRVLAAHLADAGRAIHPTVFLRLVPGNDAAAACYRAAGFTRMPPDDERAWNEGQPRAYEWMAHRA